MALKYPSQNDPRWKYERMGTSTATLGKYGCLTTSISCLGNYYGEDRNPSELAKKLSYTKSGLLNWKSIDSAYHTMKFKWRFYSFDKDLIDKALKSTESVAVLNVDRGFHWVALLSKIPGIGYICSDPYPFPSRKRLYKFSEVCGGAILTRA